MVQPPARHVRVRDLGRRRAQGLFLARDPYGIKPLYVSDDGRTLRFASQVKALLAGGRRRARAGAGRGRGLPPVRPCARAVHPLPRHPRAAGRLHAVGGRAPAPTRPSRSSASQPSWPRAPTDPAPPAELAERVRAAVAGSVAAHMLSDVEVGAFLSAGVDSGAMLGLMREASGSDMRAITLAFEEFRGTAEDEAPLAAEVAARYGARHEVRRVARTEFEADLPAILAAMDQPSIDGVNTWFVAKAAKEAGLKVAISGLGGDELLAGYPSFVDLPRWRRRYGPLAACRPRRAVARRVLQAAGARPCCASGRRRPACWNTPAAGRAPTCCAAALFLPHELPALIGAGRGARGPASGWRLTSLLARSLAPDPGSDVGRVCALESLNYMRNQLLRDADWAGMAHGVEIRAPLVDIELLRALAPSIADADARRRQGRAGRRAAHRPAGRDRQPRQDRLLRPDRRLDGRGRRPRRSARKPASKGLASRHWARQVFGAAPRARRWPLPASRRPSRDRCGHPGGGAVPDGRLGRHRPLRAADHHGAGLARRASAAWRSRTRRPTLVGGLKTRAFRGNRSGLRRRQPDRRADQRLGDLRLRRHRAGARAAGPRSAGPMRSGRTAGRSGPENLRPDYARAIRGARAVFVNSRHTGARLAAEPAGPDDHPRLPARHREGPADECGHGRGGARREQMVLFVGRNDEMFAKGQDVLIAAWPKVVAEVSGRDAVLRRRRRAAGPAARAGGRLARRGLDRGAGPALATPRWRRCAAAPGCSPCSATSRASAWCSPRR